MFVVQGRILVEDAADAGLDIREVYLREGEPAPRGVKVMPFVLDARTFDSVNDTVAPQGVLAVCAVPAAKEMSVADTDWYVAADGIADPGNLGTIIRSAEAAGASGVIVTQGTVDVWSPKTVRSSAGGSFRVPIHHVSDLADVRKKGIRLLGTTSQSSAPSMYDVDLSGCVAIVLGNEAHGLDVAADVDGWVRIPHHGRAESLNVAMAASVLSLHAAHVRSHR